MSLLFPQISFGLATGIATKLQRLPATTVARHWAKVSEPAAVYTAVGGARVTPQKLHEIRRELLEFADEAGYPETAGEERRLWFDTAASALLHKRMRIVLGEA